MNTIRRIGAWLRKWLTLKNTVVVPEPPTPINDNGVYITAKQANDIIVAALGKRLASRSHIHLADAEYYCPSKEYVEHLVEQDNTDSNIYAAERFDCDDFSFTLKASFCIDAYRNGVRRSAHAAGIVWGKIPHPHAMNWVITDDLKLRLIEPQTDAWKEWGDKFSIWLMAA